MRDQDIRRIQVDGIRRRRPVGYDRVWVRPIFDVLDDDMPRGSFHWRSQELTEQELDQWVRTSALPMWALEEE